MKGIIYLNLFYASKVTLNLYINVWLFDIIVMVSHPIPNRDISFHIFQFSAMSLNSFPHINIAYFWLD